MIGRLSPVVVIGFALLVPRPAAAQGEPASGRLDSIAVAGNRRVSRNAIVQASGLALGRTLSYRDIQRAIQDLYATGQFDDVRIGADTAAGQSDTKASFDRMAEKVKDEINKTFNPEFLNRLDDVIVFHPLSREHIGLIVAILVREVQKRLGEEELTLKLTPAASSFLVDHGYDEHFGARPLKRAIQRYVEDPLSEKILVGEFARGDEIEVDVAPDKERLAFRALSGTKA